MVSTQSRNVPFGLISQEADIGREAETREWIEGMAEDIRDEAR